MTQCGVDQPHFRCPPLRDWLVPLATNGALVTRQKPVPRSLRSLVDAWPELGAQGPSTNLVVIVDEIDPAWFEVAVQRVSPGGWLVELRPLAAGLFQTLLGLRSASDESGQVGYASAARFVSRGLFDVQQWACSDPAELLVTCGRRR